MSHSVEYNSMAFPEYIVKLFQRWTHLSTVHVPKKCGVCGRPSAGNWLTGYYLPCVQDIHQHEGEEIRISIIIDDIYSEWKNIPEVQEEGHDDYFWHGADSFKEFLVERLKSK